MSKSLGGKRYRQIIILEKSQIRLILLWMYLLNKKVLGVWSQTKQSGKKIEPACKPINYLVDQTLKYGKKNYSQSVNRYSLCAQ